MQAKGFLFDMDGVIAHTNPTHKDSILVFCERHGIETNDEFLKEKVYGRVNAEWIPNLFGNLSPAEVKQLADEKEAIFREMFAEHLIPVDGLLDVLENLKRAGVPAAVCTAAPPENADYILDGLGIRSYFQFVLTSDNFTHGKPHPEIYLLGANKIGIPNKDLIVLEDSLAGVQAGKSAGSFVIGIGTTHTAAELTQADVWMEDFTSFKLDEFIH